MNSDDLNFAFVLYVEDDEMSRTVMRLMLKTIIGMENFAIFEDSKNFLQRVKALPRQPDLILLDIHVHPHDGFDMLAMLRSDPEYHTSRVVALTASVMIEEIEAIRSAGFDSAIGKPLYIATFPGYLDRIIRGESVWQV